MSKQHGSNKLLLEVDMFETRQNIEILECCLLESEEQQTFSHALFSYALKDPIATMQYNNISVPAHQMEDLLYYIRRVWYEICRRM